MHSVNKLSLLIFFSLFLHTIEAREKLLLKLISRQGTDLWRKKFDKTPFQVTISLEEQFADLVRAVSESNLGATKKILRWGGRASTLVNRMVVDPRSNSEMTLLHVQASLRHPDAGIMDALMTAGTDPNKPDSNGECLVHYAVKQTSTSSLKAVKHIFQGTLNIEVIDNNGQTVFHKISHQSQIGILCKNNDAVGTLVNHQDNEGRTPLHCIIQRQHNDIHTLVSIVESLKKNGASLTIEDNHNRLPVFYATKLGRDFQELIDLVTPLETPADSEETVEPPADS